MSVDLSPEEVDAMSEVDAYRKAWCECGWPYMAHRPGAPIAVPGPARPCETFTPTDDLRPPPGLPRDVVLLRLDYWKDGVG
jgi:hypothetical protein